MMKKIRKIIAVLLATNCMLGMTINAQAGSGENSVTDIGYQITARGNAVFYGSYISGTGTVARLNQAIVTTKAHCYGTGYNSIGSAVGGYVGDNEEINYVVTAEGSYVCPLQVYYMIAGCYNPQTQHHVETYTINAS